MADRPERLKLWNVSVRIGDKKSRRIQVASDETNYAGTIELRVKSYYKSLIKDGTKITVKAKLSKRASVFVY